MTKKNGTKANGKNTNGTAVVPEGFTLSLRTDPRLLVEHLGRQKYATPAKALAELIMNGFDADGTLVQVDLLRNATGLIIDQILVSDNGVGMSEHDLKERFQHVGVHAREDGKSRLGRFGVGRLAVFRLGLRSHWRTVSRTDGVVKSYEFDLHTSSPDEFPVKVAVVNPKTPLGTSISIEGLLDEQTQRMTDRQLSWDLFSEFASYLFAWQHKHLQINGETIELADRVMERRVERLTPEKAGVPALTTLEHLLLKSPVQGSRVPEQLILTAKGVAVERLALPDPPAPNYLALVSSPYLDELVAENRAAFVNMDGGIATMKTIIDKRISVYGERYRRDNADDFLKRAREKDYYPYRGEPANAMVQVEQTLYDSILKLVNDAVNVENLGRNQQRLIFDLLHRALRDENLLQVLDHLAGLSQEDVQQFREVLGRTTLQSIIRLSSEVSDRILFLDGLKDIIYGEDGKHLRERSQLHKLLEPNCWIFGPQFHLATSDKGFQSVIRRQREAAGLEPIPDVEIKKIAGIKQIPDLFLAAHRDYAHGEGHHHQHLIVELKRPAQAVNKAVVEQGESYASVLHSCSEFDQEKTTWDLYLVSSEIDEKVVNLKRRQPNEPVGYLTTIGNVRIFAFKWGEIIESARDEMRLVLDNLEVKSKELSASDYLKTKYMKVLKPKSDGHGEKKRA